MSFWSEITIKGGRFGGKNQCSVDIMAAGGQNLEELVRRIVSSVHKFDWKQQHSYKWKQCSW